MADIDRQNTARMKEIIAQHGWPTVLGVGQDGARSAWLLVQHADHDVAFQKMCLSLMKAVEGKNQVRPADVAYLTDRVRVNQGEPQVYGTQFHVIEGRRQPRPIREPDTVDERRAAMGLSTLEEYTAFINT